LTIPLLIAILSWANVVDSPELHGTIQGVVVNGTRDNEPIGDVEVLLRAGPEGMLEPVAKTRTDMYGKFEFEDVPLEPTIVYLPGADRDGVHYPGERIRLGSDNRLAHVTIVAFDAIESPTPLIVQRHDIALDVQQDAVEISETLFVTNPSRTTYVGEQVADMSPTTLRLSVPPNFDRVTFSSEFYGRRFRVDDHQPVTDIPWPPGHRELKFSYRIPIDTSGGMFRRLLDLPARNITLRLRGRNPEEVSCNLQGAENSSNEIVFASAEQEFPAGHTIELQIGDLPFPWTQCARWGSLIALGAIAVTTAIVLQRRDEADRSAKRSHASKPMMRTAG
jgi:hypothetical protein